MATLQKKLLVNSVSVLFDLLGSVGSREAVMAASSFLGAGIYRLFRCLYQVSASARKDIFSVSGGHFQAGVVTADMIYSEAEYTDALAAHVKDKGRVPDMDHEALSAAYPGAYQSLYQVIHTTGERVQRMAAMRQRES